MLEFTRKQRIVNTPVLLKIRHEYPEPFYGEMLTYTLEEIFGEKLIAMYSNAIKLHERGWTRSRARDYYDLFRLLTDFGDALDAQKVLNTIKFKTDTRIPITSVNDFFDTSVLKLVEIDWEQQLHQMILPLPTYKEVVPQLRLMLQAFLSLPLAQDESIKRLQL